MNDSKKSCLFLPGWTREISRISGVFIDFVTTQVLKRHEVVTELPGEEKFTEEAG